MSNPRSVTVADLPIAGAPGHFYNITIRFLDRRGYYLSVQPMERKEYPRDPANPDDGRTVTIDSFMCFSGKSEVLEASARFNAKRLAALAADPATRSKADAMIAALQAADAKQAREDGDPDPAVRAAGNLSPAAPAHSARNSEGLE